jgi:hypothetical protein
VRAALIAFAVLRFGLKLELGPEFDSNANRAETYLTPPQVPSTDTPPPSPIPSFLLRTTAAGTFAWTTGRNSLRGGLTVGGKLFFDSAAVPQDTLVLKAAADDNVLVAGPLLLGLSADWFDTIQFVRCPDISSGGVLIADPSCHRDFRSIGARASATFTDGDFAVALLGGGQSFTWRPDDDLSFNGATVGTSAAAHLRSGPPEDESEWDLALVGRVDWRWYLGPALTGPNDPGTSDPRRRDIDALASLSISHVGKVLASVAYTVDYNRSTSYGQSFLRQLVTLKLAFDLPWKITATTRLQLVFLSYINGTPLTSGTSQVLNIEEENRDNILLDLERPLGRSFAVNARYSYFSNGVSNTVLEYARHVGYLGITYKLR